MTELARPHADPTPERVRDFIAAIPLYRDDDDPAFWPDDRLRARQEELLVRQLGWLQEASPHYRRLFAEHGVDVARVRTLDDLERLPVTTKAELMADPGSFRLRFASPGLHDLTYTTVYTTGTTTGRPTPYEYTAHDVFGAALAGRRVNKAMYLVPGDTMLSAFPLSPLPHVAGFASLNASASGVAFLHGLSGTPYGEFAVHRPSSAIAGTIESVRPQALAGIGSYLRRMFVDAAASGRDFSSLRVITASGEVLTARMRDHMREHLARAGASDVYVTSAYGYTEGGVAAVACHEAGPLHNSAPDQIYYEILDPDTHERLPEGEPGLVAITHLNRRGMPLLRYLLGDVSVLSHERCPRCGRGGQSLLVSSGSAHVTRTSELLKIKGTLVNPQVVHDVVMNTPGVVEYQLVVTNEVEGDPMSADRLILRLGLDGAAAWDGEALRWAVHRATEVRPELELVHDLSEIYDPVRELKARRLVDRRPPPD